MQVYKDFYDAPPARSDKLGPPAVAQHESINYSSNGTLGFCFKPDFTQSITRNIPLWREKKI